MVGKQRYSVCSSVKIGFCHIFLFSFLISYVISFSFFALFSFQCYLCSHCLMSLWFSPCHGFHPHVVSTFSWFPPSCGFHPPMVTPWFPPSCGFHPSVVSTLHGYSMVSTLPWFGSLHGFHPHVVTSWCPFCGLHPPVVSNLPWFPPSHGYSMLSILDFGLN